MSVHSLPDHKFPYYPTCVCVSGYTSVRACVWLCVSPVFIVCCALPTHTHSLPLATTTTSQPKISIFQFYLSIGSLGERNKSRAARYVWNFVLDFPISKELFVYNFVWSRVVKCSEAVKSLEALKGISRGLLSESTSYNTQEYSKIEVTYILNNLSKNATHILLYECYGSAG